jgi:hypothetical protein
VKLRQKAGERTRTVPLLLIEASRASNSNKMARPTPKAPPDPPNQPAETNAWRFVTRPQLAELMGVHPDTVTDYARTGMPVVTRGGRGKESSYDAVACLDWWRSQQGKNATEAAKTRALEASAQLNELKLATQQGELVSRQQIIVEGQAYTKAWSTKVRALPRRMTQAGLIGREQEAGVAGLCSELLVDIANWKTLADLPGQRKGAA